MRLQKYIKEEIKKKSGIIPYYIDNGDVEILLMKPSNPAYGGSDYQIAKGNVDGDESLEDTALREGEEELGLKRSNIININKIGSNFINGYELHVFTAKVNNKTDFNAPHYETGSVEWFKVNKLDKNIREDHYKIILDIIKHIDGLNEWKVHKQYSGRDLIKPNQTILWQYIPSKGLLFTYPNGETYLDSKNLGGMIRSDNPSATHKKQLASFFEKLNLGDGSDKRRWIEDNYESFVRGRIVGNDLYVYSHTSVGIEAKKYDKMIDRAIDAIYDFVEEIDT